MSVMFYPLLFFLFFVSQGWAESPPSFKVSQKTPAESTVSHQQTEQQVAAWNSEKEQLLTRIRNLQNQLRLLRYQQAKYTSYATKQEANILGIEDKKESLEKLERELDPYLNNVLERLKNFVQTDMPFLVEEREKRLAFLEESMADYHLTTSEKFRRILEALQVEAGYGKGAEVDETFVTLHGEPTKVQRLRLGRVALYYLTLDGKTAGSFDRKTGQWQELPGSFAVELKSAIQMVGKSRTMELVHLPVAHCSD